MLRKLSTLRVGTIAALRFTVTAINEGTGVVSVDLIDEVNTVVGSGTVNGLTGEIEADLIDFADTDVDVTVQVFEPGDIIQVDGTPDGEIAVVLGMSPDNVNVYINENRDRVTNSGTARLVGHIDPGELDLP